MKLFASFIIITFVFTLIFLFIYLISEPYYGLSDAATLDFKSIDKEIFSSTIIALCTSAGIFSKHVYDILMVPSKRKIRLKETFFTLFKGIVLSIILAPIVVGSFLDELKQLGSPVVAMVFAYQNGFFFHTIFQKKENT